MGGRKPAGRSRGWLARRSPGHSWSSRRTMTSQVKLTRAEKIRSTDPRGGLADSATRAGDPGRRPGCLRTTPKANLGSGCFDEKLAYRGAAARNRSGSKLRPGDAGSAGKDGDHQAIPASQATVGPSSARTGLCSRRWAHAEWVMSRSNARDPASPGPPRTRSVIRLPADISWETQPAMTATYGSTEGPSRSGRSPRWDGSFRFAQRGPATLPHRCLTPAAPGGQHQGHTERNEISPAHP